MAKITNVLSDNRQSGDPKSSANDLKPNSLVYGNSKIAGTCKSVSLNSRQMMSGSISAHFERESLGHTLSSNANKLSADNDDSEYQYCSKQVHA
jgi:hypothetical protein